MTHSERPKHWIAHLAGEVAIDFGPRLKQQFEAGSVTRLCDCGCHSFEFEVASGADIEPLVTPTGKGGAFFEVVYEASEVPELSFLVFADAAGNLAGIDITAGTANHTPLPAVVTPRKLLYTSYLGPRMPNAS